MSLDLLRVKRVGTTATEMTMHEAVKEIIEVWRATKGHEELSAAELLGVLKEDI